MTRLSSIPRDLNEEWSPESTAEMLQIANYGIGGHYMIHRLDERLHDAQVGRLRFYEFFNKVEICPRQGVSGDVGPPNVTKYQAEEEQAL